MAKKKYNGVWYESGFEANVAKDLDERGINFAYEPFRLHFFSKKKGAFCDDCKSTNVLVDRTYTPDFILDNGVIIEAKGKFMPSIRTKMQDVIANNPDRDIRMLLQYDAWMTKKKVTRLSTWCERNGILYAVKTVPDEWVN